MKKTILLIGIVAFVLLPVLLFAGHPDIRIEKNVKQRKADVAKVADPDARVTYAQIKSDLDTVGTAIDAVSTAIDAIDLTTVDPAVFTGTQKTCVQNLKGALSDLKTATKNLKTAARNNQQATNKLVKKLKESERIDKGTK
jgi:hypothetical protein